MRATTRERAAIALRSHAPGHAGMELVELGHGLDNTAYAAGDLVLRVAGGGSVAREARLLAVLADRLPLPVPVPLLADDETGVLGYERLPGRPLLGLPPPPGAARTLGGFLRALHSIDRAAVDGLIPSEDADPAEWLEELDGPRDLVRELHRTRPGPAHRRVVAHNDLGAEHVLALGATLTGVIDWSDAAVTDPAVDLARLYRDFGPAFLAELLQAYGPLPDAAERIEFFARCAALEDLAYGEATGRREYVENAERSLGWLFAGPR